MDKEDVVNTYSEILLKHKNKIMSFAATWMDLLKSELGAWGRDILGVGISRCNDYM